MNQLLLYSFAIFLGIMIWDLSMALLASTFRKFLTPKLLFLISTASGLSLVGFGLYFGYEAMQILFFLTQRSLSSHISLNVLNYVTIRQHNLACSVL